MAPGGESVGREIAFLKTLGGFHLSGTCPAATASGFRKNQPRNPGALVVWREVEIGLVIPRRALREWTAHRDRARVGILGNVHPLAPVDDVDWKTAACIRCSKRRYVNNMPS